jgi:hypothetical protein
MSVRGIARVRVLVFEALKESLQTEDTAQDMDKRKSVEFDRSKLRRRTLTERKHDLSLETVAPLNKIQPIDPVFSLVAEKIVAAKQAGASVILMIGGHVIRSGAQRYLIDLLKRGFISAVAMNGACIIHDYEFALIGQTTESVARYIQEGQFGLWEETGRLNDIINEAHKQNLGMGEAIGKTILERNAPYRDLSLLAWGYRLDIPMTVHVGIGYDIIHEHPNCDGAATGATSYRDFLRFAAIVANLEGGVVMNFGSAVMGPEVFLKALSMARNVAHQGGKKINDFTALVCDLQPLPSDTRREPDKADSSYYFRPWKTMLVRTVADGGQSFYVQGKHSSTIPQLWSALIDSSH